MVLAGWRPASDGGGLVRPSIEPEPEADFADRLQAPVTEDLCRDSQPVLLAVDADVGDVQADHLAGILSTVSHVGVVLAQIQLPYVDAVVETSVGLERGAFDQLVLVVTHVTLRPHHQQLGLTDLLDRREVEERLGVHCDHLADAGRCEAGYHSDRPAVAILVSQAQDRIRLLLRRRRQEEVEENEAGRQGRDEAGHDALQ